MHTIGTYLLLFAALTCTARTQVVINELAWDDTGIDDREFVELFNASTSTTYPIGGWELRFMSNSSTTSYFLPAVTLAPGQTFVIGNTWSTPAMLVGPGSFPNSAHVVSLRDGSTVLDSVGYEGFAGALASQVEGDPIFPDFQSTPGHETSWARLDDGTDTDRNSADFRLATATPGLPNNTGTVAVPTPCETADSITPGQPIPNWEHSGSAAVVAATNSVTGPSSQGGNVLSFPIGNGSTYWFNAAPFDGNFIKTEVYLDPTFVASGMRSWSIGVRGGTGSSYGQPAPRSTGTDENGDRGVAWTFVVTDVSARLYLIDNNDGGRSHVLLLDQAVNSAGWHTLGLHVAGRRCVATLDNTCYHFPVSWAQGNVYVGGGSFGSAPPATLYLDNVCLRNVTDQVSSQGIGCQGTCSQVNFAADTLDTGPTFTPPQAGAIAYAVLVNPATLTGYTQFCVLSASRTAVANGTTITLREAIPSGSSYTPGAVLTDPNSSPYQGMSVHYHLANGSTTATRMGPGWWAADLTRIVGTSKIPFSRSTRFFAEISVDPNSYLPVARTEDGPNAGYQPASSSIWSTTNGSTWTPMSSSYNWAWAAVCQDDTSDVQAESDSELTPGSTMELVLRGAGATDPALGSFGLGIGILGATPFAVPLAAFGMPGCTAYVDTILLSAAVPTNAVGMARFSVPLPASPALIGAVFYSQWVATDPGINAAGLVTTARLSLEIQ